MSNVLTKRWRRGHVLLLCIGIIAFVLVDWFVGCELIGLALILHFSMAERRS